MSRDTVDLLTAMLHALAGTLAVVALIVLIAAAWEFGRRKDQTTREERERAHNRVGLDKSGTRLLPDGDPVWTAGQKLRRRLRRPRE